MSENASRLGISSLTKRVDKQLIEKSQFGKNTLGKQKTAFNWLEFVLLHFLSRDKMGKQFFKNKLNLYPIIFARAYFSYLSLPTAGFSL